MAMRTLFHSGVPSDCHVFRMEADELDLLTSVIRYEAVLPETVDILILGVGDDGHIASLFPGSSVLEEDCRKVVSVSCPKPPHERLTITPSVIAHAKLVFVLAPGAVKAQVLEQLLHSKVSVTDCPARLVKNAIWLLDTQLLDRSCC
jgi:6-phosphogluconolactonase